MLQRVLSSVVDVRKEESLTALLMFTYSFLAMTSSNAIKPLTRSKFISDLGADNLPYVLLAAGFVIGILMTGYGWMMARLPRRWALPLPQGGLAAPPRAPPRRLRHRHPDDGLRLDDGASPSTVGASHHAGRHGRHPAALLGPV